MILEQALYNYLSTASGVVAVVGTGVYPMRLPQDAPLPALVYHQVSGPRVRTFGGDQGGTPRFQVTGIGKTYLDAKSAANAARAALEGYAGTMGGVGGVDVKAIQQVNQADAFEPQTQLYHSAVDFIITYGGF